MAQIAYHISRGIPLWDYPVRKAAVLYLALEDDYRRLQERLYRMFGTDGADNLFFSVSAGNLGNGLDEQLQEFMKQHTETRLIIIDTLQKIREVGGDNYSYANDYEIITRLKQLADSYGICILLVHHTRKQNSDGKFDMISGTTGLLGAADGAFLLQKEKRTGNAATLEISGRGQQGQKLYLIRNTETLLWELEKAETELWKGPTGPLLERIAEIFSSGNKTWEGTPTELCGYLGVDMQANALTRKLNVNAGRLLNEYGNSKQEKPFHELILQIGDKENMGAGSENGQVARQILDEYYHGFQERNPNLYVFSAHIHMDEATPHLHIDFVPFTTGSKRGLDTRVSLKQALAAQGFKGGSRGDTEWSQWVQSEKENLAAVMGRHGIEWEHKGTHEKHLSVLDYKKQEREKEVIQLEGQISEKKEEFQVLSDRVENYDKGMENLKTLEQALDTSPEYQLPEPQGLMSAKSYKNKVAKPLVQKLKSLVKTAFVRCFEAWDSYYRLNVTNSNVHRENEGLRKINEKWRGRTKTSVRKTKIISCSVRHLEASR